jgi:D-lactate dehydrogenase
MKVYFFEAGEVDKEKVSKALNKHEVIYIDEPLTKKNVSLAKDADILSVFIYSKIDKKILSKLPNLKLITTQSTGFDHIDLKECRKRKIPVCNVPSYGENTVAEHTFALILDLSRNIHKAIKRISEDNFSIKGLQGFDLKGKTIGVIGAGNIGQHVIRIAKGFEMNVLAYEPKRNSSIAKKLGFKYVTLENLLKKSDIITLHVPLVKETKNLINARTLKLMKPNSILINTSRGGVVNTKSLLSAIESGKIGGAGLDVLEGEKTIKEEKELLHKTGTEHTKKLKSLIDSYMILHNEKVIFTPHIAFYSKEALERIMDTNIENIKSFVKGKPKNNLIK